MNRACRLLAGAAAGLLLTVAAAAPAAAAPGPGSAPEYWFDTWQVPQLWQSGARGQGTVIAELDTGVNGALPELAPNLLPGIDYGQGGDGRVDRETSAFGHGTAMASIMVGQRGILGITGLAPAARLLPVALPLSGTTDASGNDHLDEAIRWSVDHGSKIISMSLGGARQPARDAVPCPTAVQDAVYYALEHGAVLLAAAGNRGLVGSPVEEPGVCLGVISVGAVDSTGAVANFSSRHPYLTLTAPGVNIASLSRVMGSAYSGDGTSQATAIASAVIALVWSKYPQLTGREVLSRVLATLDRRTATRDPGYGYGVINAYRAVTAPVPADAPNPVFAAADPFQARTLGFARPGTPPPPAAAANAPLGAFSVGSAPRLLAPAVLTGLAVTGVGLLALAALGVLGWRSRRAPPGEPPTGEPPTGGAGAQPESGEVRWHHIVDTGATPGD